MKNVLVFFSIFTVLCIAVYDVRERAKELEDVAANTPAQVEMKQMINKPGEVPKSDILFEQKNNENPVKVFQESDKYRQNQLKNIEKRRETIDKKDY